MSHPFGRYAADYWAMGVNVLPTQPGTKQPAYGIKHWSSYCNNSPKPATQVEWRKTYRSNGISAALGTVITPGLRLGAIDVDDDYLVEVHSNEKPAKIHDQTGLHL
jgi:hypothetical protein